ncbi:MAG: rhomboid family intramembrane serine protease [Prosthecobacter sp.]|nr:rhomboid family intramembrane serine protease [Prosthecobacter sp.]
MTWFRESQDHLPLTWWKGHPVYLSAILALAGVASMILTAIIGYDLLGILVFSYDNLMHRFFLWTPLTYALVNPPDLWLVLGCFLLWRFGEAVERHLGRRAFVRLVVLLLVALPILILLLGFAGMRGQVLLGMNHLQFGVFLAFATLYPRAQISLIIATIEVWILAAIIVGIYALGALASRNWASLLMLATECAVAYGFIRYEQGQLQWPALSSLIPRTKPQRQDRSLLPTRPAKAKKARTAVREQSDVDEILDKISREGMHSLTAEERIILERASDDLQKRKR